MAHQRGARAPQFDGAFVKGHPIVRPRAWTAALPDGRFVEIREAPAPGGGWVSTYRDVTALHERSVMVAERLSLQTIDLVPDNLWLEDAGSGFSSPITRERTSSSC